MQPEILIVTQCFYPDVGGIENLMTALTEHCVLAGRNVTVVAERIRSKPGTPAAEKPYPIARFGGPRPWRRWRKRAHIASLLGGRGNRIAGIFADSWKSLEALPSGITIPVTTLAYGMEYPLDASLSKKRRIAAALSRCTAVLPISRYTSGLVVPYLGEDAGKMKIVLPPCPSLPEPGPNALAAMREKLGGRSPVIATVARLEPRKGIDSVIRAIAELLKHYPRCLYAIAGGGADRPRLEELARSLHVEDSVLFLGRVDDAEKAALLSLADVFAMPVRREGRSVEGFGISYLEAGWFGVPALAGRDGGAADAVLDGETGLVCDGANQSEVTRSLLTLVSDEALRKRLGAAAQQRVRNELIWPVAIERYLGSLAPAS